LINIKAVYECIKRKKLKHLSLPKIKDECLFFKPFGVLATLINENTYVLKSINDFKNNLLLNIYVFIFSSISSQRKKSFI